MLLKSLLTSALLALSLGSDVATASKHGRFAEKARAPQEKAKRAIEARNHNHLKSNKDYRFLNKKTQRACRCNVVATGVRLTNP
jgi:carboxypeptidase D